MAQTSGRFRCIYCGHMRTPVLTADAREDRPIIVRRRSCKKCGKEFKTYELAISNKEAVAKLTKARMRAEELNLLLNQIHI